MSSLDCGTPADFDTRSRSLDLIVRLYRRDHQPRLAAQLESFASEATLESALVRAALAQRPDGKKYSHQGRIKRSVLAESRRRLLTLDLSRVSSFAALHLTVGDALGSISGAGDLLVYDTSLRIGAKLGLYPSEVYMHAGTRDGAKTLGLGWRRTTLPLEELPAPFHSLQPHEVEDCLCIFKKQFGRPSRTSPESEAPNCR